MLRAGIIGCGKIAEVHVDEIQKLSTCQIVGVCDREPLMAKQLGERYNIKHYESAEQLLDTCKPDVVHITTPPQSHFELAKLSLSCGSHVYLEKPFTLNLEEAETLIEIARRQGLKLTVGHNYQFDPAALTMRELVGRGVLGGPPVHLESVYCYDLNDEFARALVGNREHWVRNLPGKLLHNVISHGICKIAEFIGDDFPEVVAHGYASPAMLKLLGTGFVDELRVTIQTKDTSAYFTFSSQMRPGLHQFRLFGRRSNIWVDYNHQTVVVGENRQYKSHLSRLIPPFAFSRQYFSSGVRNAIKFLKADFHANAGMHFLIKSFYESVRDNAPLPIPYEQILLTTRIMDQVFEQLKSGPREANLVA